VRDGEALNEKLCNETLPNSPVLMSVLTLMDNPLNDDLRLFGCPFAFKSYSARVDTNIGKEDFFWKSDLARVPIASALDLDPSSVQTFMDVWWNSDALTAILSEGH
jgi:hypothetical protein